MVSTGLIENTVGIQTTIAQDPMSVVAIGHGMLRTVSRCL